MSSAPAKPITANKIPGTDVPDVTSVPEPARQKRWMAAVAVTTAILAAIAAISSSQNSGHLNNAMIEQIKETDQWSLYQAKGIKLAVLESRLETVRASGQQPTEADLARVKRYADEQVGIRADAEGHKIRTADHLRRSVHYGRATTACQIGIALAAIALLLRKNAFWFMAILAGLLGSAYVAMGLLA